MKKLLLAVLTATLTLSLVCFAGCKQSSHTHVLSDWIIDEQPSCEKTGLKHKECTVCNAILQFAQIDALTHEYENYVCKHCKKEYCSEGLQYKLLSDKTCAVVGVGYADPTEIVIPSIINGLSVTGLYIPDIDYGNLISITIPDSVIYIEDDTFYSHQSLTNINVDKNNTVYKSIDGNLYSKDGKTLIRYAIGKTNKSFTIPNSVTSIGDYAFYNCSSLISVTISNSVTSIGRSAFSGCNSLIYNEYNNAYYLGNDTNPYLCLMKAKSTNIKNCNINETCKFIYDSAFYCCSSLESIIIPSSVTSINDFAFSSCRKLTSITIPDTVTSIGECAFCDCSSLESITIPDSVTSIGRDIFFLCDNLTNIYYTGTQEEWDKIKNNEFCPKPIFLGNN